MKRAILILTLILAATAFAAEPLTTPQVTFPPNAQATLNLGYQLPATHKVSPDAPLTIKAIAEGAAIAKAPQDYKGKGKDMPYALTFTTGASGTGTVTVQVKAFVCQKDNEGVCQLVDVTAKIPVAIGASEHAAYDIELPVTLLP